jgi:hypothetical protein
LARVTGEEVSMSVRNLAIRSIAALTGAAMCALSLNPASALTIPAPTADRLVAPAQVDKVYWRRGWGWGPGAVIGGLAAGALLGSYYGGYYGPGYAPGYYGPGPDYYGACWRRVWGPFGWRWARLC